MDRDDLLTLLRDLNDDTLTCRVDGTLVDSEGTAHDVDDLEAAAAELAADLDTLLLWARSAPKRAVVEAATK